MLKTSARSSKSFIQKTRPNEFLINLIKMDLPIKAKQREIVEAIRTHQIVFVQGETGSGKTTQVPQYINQAFPGLSIAVTQPRRVAAINLAARVSKEVGQPIGELVGYRVRFDEKLSHKTKIKFLTDGMLLREAILD